MAVNLTTLNTIMSNSFNSWAMSGYDFRDHVDKPKWLTLVKVGRKGYRILERFPKATQEMADVLDRTDIQKIHAMGTKECSFNRKFLAIALPNIIEKLENAGFDGTEFVNELRNGLFFVQMWLEDEPDTVWTGKAGGFLKISNSGITIEEYQDA